MIIPEKLRTVTPLSKNIALALVILLPFFAFIFGMRYQKTITVPEYIETSGCPETKDEGDSRGVYYEENIFSHEVVDCA